MTPPAAQKCSSHPRYLAGTTVTDPVRASLDAAPGWTQALVGQDLYYTSPCQRLRAATRQHGEWTFTYSVDPLGMPTWSAHFERTVPDEILLAFTEPLVDVVGTYFSNYLYGGRHYTGQTPASIFAEHGWEPVHGSRPWHTLAPDEHAAFHIRTGRSDEHHELRDRGAATWKITAGPEPVASPTWTASFTGHTPTAAADRRRLCRRRPRAGPAPGTPHPRTPPRARGLATAPASPSARVAAAQARSRLSAGPPMHESPRPPTAASPSPRPAPRR